MAFSLKKNTHRDDDGNRQENPSKYYHCVRGDLNGLAESGS